MDAWYAHPIYARYWQHYQQAMNWHHRHRRAYSKALQAAYGPALHPVFPTATPRYADWHGEESNDRTHGRLRRWGREKEEEQDDPESEKEEEEESESSEESEIECNVSNMDISAELRQFFAQTERHREELKKQQQMEAERQEAYVLADQDLHRVSWRSAQPPTERPGERRSAEMKKLYGKDAAKIQGMEAAMQLTFDRNCDRKQPKYWPVIPLNL
ncbi:gem-associated protein 8 [Colossoma macropomum]|uniref:gem-associated protein 8 n=1 Tax=Colossoma macropomum TaxID=42526 RepID=UPI00186403E5|nr:gem-associated protein 8 [Colossoma macropomum]XP_036413627.1 gem-associated protein 8 [Colossoma macropomum]XP_036413628.1 gem-associated protein 8 [Colossoma macropomum]